eukprot:gene45748-61150_t
MGGEIDFASESSGWAPLVMSGKLRLLAVFTATRAKRFPEVPTVRELGLEIAVDSPGGLIGPKGMDPAVVKTLADAFREAAGEPKHLEFLDNMDQPLLLLDGPAYQAQMAKTMEQERELLRKLNLLSGPKHLPHPEERREAARLEGWARAPCPWPILRDGCCAASSG